MKKLLVYVAVLSCGVASAQMPLPSETPDMKPLFNGKDLSGWDGDSKLWSVKEGVIHGETTLENPAKGNTFLVCNSVRTGDFELRLSFRCSSTNNSGIQYRSKRFSETEVPAKWKVRGYQHELRNETKMPNVSGFIYDEGGKRARICLAGEKAEWTEVGKKVLSLLITQEEYKALFRLNDWNDVVIIAEGRHIRHYLNGRQILDFTDSPEKALLDGVLALQLHGGKPMWTEFRNVRIKELK